MTHITTTHTLPSVDRRTEHERRLRLVLRANAATSSISGLVMAVGPDTVDGLLDTGHPGWIRLVGLALVPFAAFVAWLSLSDLRHLRAHTPGIVAGDLLWVAASLATCLAGWYSTSGIVAVAAMAPAVDTFGTLQFIFWRRLRD